MLATGCICGRISSHPSDKMILQLHHRIGNFYTGHQSNDITQYAEVYASTMGGSPFCAKTQGDRGQTRAPAKQK